VDLLKKGRNFATKDQWICIKEGIFCYNTLLDLHQRGEICNLQRKCLQQKFKFSGFASKWENFAAKPSKNFASKGGIWYKPSPKK
jgi:hypothetical protein